MGNALFSFEGRLNRAPFWGYSILLTIVAIVLVLVLMSVVLASALPELLADAQGGNMQAAAARLATFAPSLGWVGLVLQVALLYPFAALSVKRRHDRNKSGRDVWIYVIAILVLSVLQQLGIGVTQTVVDGTTQLTFAPWMEWVNLAVGLFGLYLFIVLAFLPGTRGPNDYGPDPLAGRT